MVHSVIIKNVSFKQSFIINYNKGSAEDVSFDRLFDHFKAVWKCFLSELSILKGKCQLAL